VAGILLTVGSAALLFRHLGVVTSGRYVTVLALTSMITAITEIGLTTIGVRELAVGDDAAAARLMRNLLGLRLLLATAGMGAVVAFAVLADYTAAMVAGTFVAGIGVMGVAVQSTLGISLTVQLKFGWLTLLELLRQGVLVAGIVILVGLGAGLLPFLALQAPAALVALAATAWLVRRNVPMRPAFDAGQWRALLRDVLPFAAATVVVAVYFRAAMIVLGLVSSPTETGYFGASFRMVEVLLAVPSLLVGAAFPIFARAARDNHERLAYGVDRVFRISVLAGGCLLVGLVLGAPFAIDVVAGSRFAPSADVLRIQAVALALSFVATTLTYALLSLRRHREILVVACSALFVNVILVVILGDRWGADGAAVATIVAELVAVGTAALALRSASRAVLPGAGIFLRVAPAVAIGLLPWALPGLPSVVAALLGVALFSGAALVLRAVPAELWDVLPRRAAVR
jgi:O-antigen/teichoic acid export membrane protein